LTFPERQDAADHQRFLQDLARSLDPATALLNSRGCVDRIIANKIIVHRAGSGDIWKTMANAIDNAPMNISWPPLVRARIANARCIQARLLSGIVYTRRGLESHFPRFLLLSFSFTAAASRATRCI